MKAFLSVLEDSPMVLKPAISATSDTPEFSVSDVVTRIREALFSLPDTRRGGNHQRYVMGDPGLSAFSVFFMQSPSFLDYQQRMQKELGCNNASSLFGVHQIPSTQQICNLLDPVSPAHLAPVFVDLVEALHQHGSLEPYRGRWTTARGAGRDRISLLRVDPLSGVLDADTGQRQDPVPPQRAHTGDRGPGTIGGICAAPGIHPASRRFGQAGL